MSELKKLLLAFDAPGRWASSRYVRQKNRSSSGSTSIRVSKETLRSLRDVAERCAELHGDGGWRYRRGPSMSELLDWFARGVVIAPDSQLVDACKTAIAKTHAKNAGVLVHAKSDVG